jgi:hypothetical protein
MMTLAKPSTGTDAGTPVDLPARGRVGRNSPCPCGSGKKYKRCCLKQDECERHVDRATHQFEPGEGRLRQCVAYGRKVYDLREELEKLADGRVDGDIATYVVAAAVLFCGLLRIRSFNALEPKLGEKTFINLVGCSPDNRAKLCSVDTLGRVLRVMDIDGLRALGEHMVAKAERNKVFREGWVGALRFVALDGWEPICSYHRHCPECLIRYVKVKRNDGTEAVVEQYYHRYVVAMLIDERFDLVLDFEPLLPEEMRPDADQHQRDEGELTSAKRLLKRVKQTHPWLDVVLGDGLYANGPFLTVVKKLKMSAIVVAKKDGDEPLREALRIWDRKPADSTFVDEEKRERVELWDCPDLETLSSYEGPIRVVRAQITDLDDPKQRRTWCFLVTGKATVLTPRQVTKAGRGRWHIENTGFNQWTQHWKLEHVFTHDGNAIIALYWLFFVAFNLLTLFLYRQVRCYGRDRGRDVTQTISRLVDEMNDDLARMTASPWDPG